MPGWRRLLQRNDGWVLCDEHYLHYNRRRDILGVHQAGRDEDPGTAVAGLEAGGVKRRFRMNSCIRPYFCKM